MQIVVPDEFKYLYEKSAERPVVKIPDPVLRQVAKEVVKMSKKLDKLIDDMIRIMTRANGVGLAAPQVGVLERVIVIAPSGQKPLALINPVVKEVQGSESGQEGCLSIPGLYGDVPRAVSVCVEAYDRKGRPMAYDLEGMPARIVQHEIDHLDGVLFIDKVDIATLHWSHPDGEPAAE